MVRHPRLDLDGFHHIVNRVAQSNIYECDEDKEVFLNIVNNKREIGLFWFRYWVAKLKLRYQSIFLQGGDRPLNQIFSLPANFRQNHI